MSYALLITIGLGLLLLFLLGFGFVAGRRAVDAARRGGAPFGRWRWYPSRLGFLLLFALPLIGLLLWRVFPAFLLIPIIIPFFWRWQSRRRAFFRGWRPGQRRPPTNGNGNYRADDPVEGRYRPLDDE